MDQNKLDQLNEHINAFRKQVEQSARNGQGADMHLYGTQFAQQMRNLFAGENSSKKSKKKKKK
ncbi:hypothetical protein [Bacillus methanolicus]|uniref:Uncharacterized protein n=1 Tax=Bacillus methanolicus (strain MGA3 / ATCC 53907) TaxID=796606 RepID=I3E814_BACMM|nr:hypothetical protein [Bacillus methanolicus]AIE59881.1 hypothetical protein BMMGA3_07345 [Bacillus methanolicus MGA3]EIJ82635.1 hypothetical protein MGA3_05350 [Bacillus methanolicus MGA3]